jgi:hypothetical protein
MPGMPSYGPDGQWAGPDGGWQQPTGPGDRGLSGLTGKLSGLPRLRGPVIPAVGIAAVIVVIAVAIVIIRGNSGSSQNTAGTGAPAAPAATSTGSAQAQSDPQQKQAATELAGLLSQSGGDRGGVDHAYFAVQACKTLPADQKEFIKAAANRTTLVSKLQSLPDVSALSPAMIQALTGAWQASAQADGDYANWAASLEGGCKKGKTANNANLKASNGPDGQASADKQQFTKLWNPVASKYGLQTYQPGDL